MDVQMSATPQDGQGERGHRSVCMKGTARRLGQMAATVKRGLQLMTVEPVVFIDGACYWSMTVFMEVVQMEKICHVNLAFPDEVCTNFSSHPEEHVAVQKDFSKFAFYNSIIFSLFPLIFVLFMGAWSDKYGRKIPLLITLGCNVMWSGGYLLSSWMSSWPVDVLYFVTLVGAVGGGPQGLLASAIAYISDVSSVKSRTGRVSNTVSSWYLGGPLGTLVGAVAIQNAGIELALLIVFLSYLTIFSYMAFYIKESHGPFAKLKAALDRQGSSTIKKEDVTKIGMMKDFFNWRRVYESFKTAFKRREGSARLVLMALISCNMIRRAARGFFMYPFVQRALDWGAADYTYWSSYRSLVAAAGSLILVPVLTRLISITDPMLIVVGSLSAIAEYCCYGLIGSAATGFLVWLGPAAALISNASIIAQKSLATKLVSSTEKGRVSAVLAATQSLMPMVGYAIYAPIYQRTVEHFPAAQFFFGAGLAAIIMITFLAIQLSNVTFEKPVSDEEKKVSQDGNDKSNDVKMKPSHESKKRSNEDEPNPDEAKTEDPRIIRRTSGRRTVAETAKDTPRTQEDMPEPRGEAKQDAAGYGRKGEGGLVHPMGGHGGYENSLSDAEILHSETSFHSGVDRRRV